MSTAAQVLRQADALKATVSDNSKNVSEVCVSRQRLEDLYRKVLLMDLEYALDKKVEQELWNHAFKNQINTLQAQAKDKQNPKRAETQASLDLFLEMASGVYLQLLQLVCSTFKLDLPFRRKSSTYGIMKERTLSKMKINPPKKSSCLYICQYCLVHLGDIARYRQQVDQAQSYYWHAAHLIPVNGQPYNQLAILEVARGNKLSTIFYYIRSLAVRHPFPATATNLEKFFVKISKERCEFRSKLSMSEFLTAFLQFHAFIHLCVELTRAADLSEKLLASMPAHVTSQSFSWHVLVQMLAINLFAMYHASRRTDGSPDSSPDKKEALSEDEERSHDIVFNFTVNSLEILVMYTPKQEQKARSFFTMPAINIITSWLKLDRENYSKPVVKQSSLWPHLAKLFNIIQTPTVPVMLDTQGNKKPDSEVALPEDFELRSFQPIEKAHSGLSFSQSILEDRSPELLASIRCQRLVNHGKWIAEQFPSLNLLNVKEEKPGKVYFSSATPLVKVVPVTTDSMNTSEKKTVRQNVAIQAIIQKQKGSETSPERSPSNENSSQTKVSKEGRGDSKSDGHSPTKYLLGTPMKDPQFMKASSLRSSGSSPAASSVATTTNRSPTVTFQLPPQQLSPNEKQSAEKAGIKPNHSYQLRNIQTNPGPPLGAQYRQMQHQQAMKQQKLQLQHHQIQHQHQHQLQQQQQQQQQQWHGSSNSPSSYTSPDQRAESTDLPPPGISSQSGVAQAGPPQAGLPQQGPSNLALTQIMMQQQFEALQKMGASVKALNSGPRQQGLPPDRPSSHAAMIASQQQLLGAMATLHQQQQQQQQQQHQNPQQTVSNPMGMTPQQALALRQMAPRSQHHNLGPPQSQHPTLGPPQSQHPNLGPPQSQHPNLGPPQSQHPNLGPPQSQHPNLGPPQSQHPNLGPPQSQKNPGHHLQRPPSNVPRQQQPGQPPFPGPMFMHQQFQSARQPHPGLQYGAQPGPQVPTTFNRTQSDQRQIPGKFPQQEPISPGIFPHSYSGMARPNYQFGFTQPNHHPPSPHPIGTPPGGAGHMRDERDLMAGIPQLTIQPPRNLTQGPPPPVRLNNQMEQNSEPILITPDSPQAGDGPRTLYKPVESKGDSKPGESTQSGTYSLFSTTPWSVQISSAGDSKSLGSSPFSSQASSIRNSPDLGAELMAGEAGLMTGETGYNLGLGFGTGDWGGQGSEGPSQVINPNMQVHSLWSSPGPSPLQRLLEQQRQHRQNDPH